METEERKIIKKTAEREGLSEEYVIDNLRNFIISEGDLKYV